MLFTVAYKRFNAKESRYTVNSLSRALKVKSLYFISIQ